MNKKFKTIGIISIQASLIIVIGCMFGFYNNKEVSLRNQSTAQIGKIEGVYDKMWKVIQQKAQVTSEYKDAFKEIYPELISGRYSGESMMKWIQESNPEFDASLYKDLMQSIEILRTEFQHAQENQLDIIREHTNLCTTYPSKWFVSNKEPIEYTIISSTKSKATMKTGLDDDISVF